MSGEVHYHCSISHNQKILLLLKTPAGDPIDLIAEHFIPADAVMLIAAQNPDTEPLQNGWMALSWMKIIQRIENKN